MLRAIVVLFFLPWSIPLAGQVDPLQGLDREAGAALFALSFVVLAYCGMQPPDPPFR